MDKNEIFRKIPGADTMLADDCVQELMRQYGYGAVHSALSGLLDGVRSKIAGLIREEGDPDRVSAAAAALTDKERLREELRSVLERTLKPGMTRVMNGTGVVLHTGLGRAPLPTEAVKKAAQISAGYSNLEYQPQTGKRGDRNSHFEKLLCRITGAEAAVAVNNNAAAVLLVLGALAAGGEVIVSRGELVEIGGGFRIPEVMEQSGARLREVGTTNRTRVSDYEHALGPETRAIMKVHTSNYRITGFTESADIGELASIKERDVPLIQDLGSGILIDLEGYGMEHEPTVQESLKKGADIVCFSGDKLLGGPQAGIIAGKKKYIEMIRKHPLYRAVRIDKFTASVLENVLREYLDPAKAVRRIPVLKMLTQTEEELRDTAKYLAERLKEMDARAKEGRPYSLEITAEACLSRAGGGSLPETQMKSWAVVLKPSGITAPAFARMLNNLPVPVIGRVSGDKVYLDVRTLCAGQMSREEAADCLEEVFL